MDIKTHFDDSLSFEEQIVTLVDQAVLNSEQWQTRPILVSPPSLAVLACVLLAEIHGRRPCGGSP